MLLTSTFILIVYNNSAALTSTPNIISSVNIAPKRGMPLDYNKNSNNNINKQ